MKEANIIEEQLDNQKRKNEFRKAEHPDWPTHKSILYPPGGPPKVVSECVPVGRWENRGFCKYCYSTHSEWWLMDQADYSVGAQDDDPPIVLCGRCEHTSRWDFAESAAS